MRRLCSASNSRVNEPGKRGRSGATRRKTIAPRRSASIRAVFRTLSINAGMSTFSTVVAAAGWTTPFVAALERDLLHGRREPFGFPADDVTVGAHVLTTADDSPCHILPDRLKRRKRAFQLMGSSHKDFPLPSSNFAVVDTASLGGNEQQNQNGQGYCRGHQRDRCCSSCLFLVVRPIPVHRRKDKGDNKENYTQRNEQSHNDQERERVFRHRVILAIGGRRLITAGLLPHCDFTFVTFHAPLPSPKLHTGNHCQSKSS